MTSRLSLRPCGAIAFGLVLCASVAQAWSRSAGASSPAPSESIPQVEIIHTGCFHGNEVPTGYGGEWWSLNKRGEAFELAARTVRIEPCHDVVVDDPGEKSAIEVAVDGEGTPLFLIRGIGDIGHPSVTILTAKLDPRPSTDDGSTYLRPGQHLKLRMGPVEYQLEAHGTYDPTRPDYDRLVLGYRLTMSGPDGTSQDLPVPARFAEDGVPTLLWAGDLDRDGKLDLYMDLTAHYNLRDYTLLLSSHASPGQLVKKVASRSYVGC